MKKINQARKESKKYQHEEINIQQKRKKKKRQWWHEITHAAGMKSSVKIRLDDSSMRERERETGRIKGNIL
jgi:hypothetical protein